MNPSDVKFVSHPDALFVSHPKALWAWEPFGDRYALTINLTCAPSWLARTACTLILGSKWRKLT